MDQNYCKVPRGHVMFMTGNLETIIDHYVYCPIPMGHVINPIQEEVNHPDMMYRCNGYQSRDHYLRSLAKDNGMEYADVLVMAHLLGPEEDFDLLPNCLGNDL